MTPDAERTVAARHVEPHDCTREGPWTACDYNRYIRSATPAGSSPEYEHGWNDAMRELRVGAATPADSLDALRTALDAAYRERNALVAALIRVGGYPAEVVMAPDTEGWWIVYAETPAGQVSWHISPDDMDLFRDWPVAFGSKDSPWDGHTTEEKYARLAALRTGQRSPRNDKPEPMQRQMDEAAFVLVGVLELQRFRGRMSKVTVGDIAGVLGAAHNLTTDALRAVLHDPEEGSSKPPEPAWGKHGAHRQAAVLRAASKLGQRSETEP